MRLLAKHDGYMRKKTKATHLRSWFCRDGELKIRDEIKGSGLVKAISRIHLAPGVECKEEKNALSCRKKGVQFRIEFTEVDHFTIQEAQSANSFGHRINRAVIELHIPLHQDLKELSYSIKWD